MAGRIITSGNTKLVFNTAGFQSILNSAALESDIKQRAESIASAAGEGFEAQTFKAGFGGGRVAAVVKTATTEAREAQAVGDVLTSALDAGR